ncbi:putative ABC transporter [Emiliania huxleyi CCMP1516]|uniref:AAA+ ATPase domain-containing protein n=2 Tax=Emiliania huxleyi TaxID=2903 RepID=A0A0D3IM95_EMIH1|nr:putative ABC transporter [Emiliania huxleyi CCMP1516]EOD12380.1 putative ABC transporter [Emiliania huxleyi CCMP1516]|eukprot:XP_005764809.1 putative ABC transporter [Emiliania huxleyi CCMP1516]
MVHQVEGSVLSRLLRAWVNEPRGRVLLAGWAVTFVGVTGRAVFLRLKLKARRALKPPAEKDGTLVAPPPPSRPPKAPGPLRTVLRLAMPSYWSRSAAWLGVFSLGLGVRLAVSVKVSSEIGSLGSLLAKGEWEELFSRQLTYALWALPAAATTALQKFSRERAALCLRERLLQTVVDKLGAAGADAPLMPAPEGTATRRLPGALAAAAEGSADTSRGGAVGVCLTDPAEFCSSAVELYEALSKPLVEVSLLSVKLALMMGPGPLCYCYSFFFAAGCWTRFAGPSIATMTTGAELLALHSHLVEYAEEVALMGGGAAEAEALHASLAAAAGRTSQLQLQRFGILAAFTAMLPAVVRAAPGGADPTEYFLTSLHLLVHDLVLSHKTAATASAHARRVLALLTSLEPAHAEAANGNGAAKKGGEGAAPPLLERALVQARTAGSGMALELRSVVIAPPALSEPPLAGPLSASVPRGAHVFVSGPNGCGKSSLLRARAGEVSTPPSDRIVALPQRPYILPTGSQAQLLYPTPLADAAPAADAMFLEAQIGSAAWEVCRGGGSLSGGERQRLAAARLYLACRSSSPPALIVADEPTSACEAGFEERFFAFLAASEAATLVVAHRPELARHHTHELAFDGHGGAAMREL